MTDTFELPVTYKGKELHFPANLVQTGYSHKFRIDLYGTDVYFEPDEEGSYRAIVQPEELSPDFDTELLSAVAEAIVAVLR